MSRAGAESRESRASDTLLVRIAEKPLVVAALFLFTALFPWFLYFLIPILAKASLLDLIQWLSLPVLFLLVNAILIFQWINGRDSRPTHVDPEEYPFIKPPSIDAAVSEEKLVKQEVHEHVQEHEDESKFSFSGASSSSSTDSEPEVGDDTHAKVAEVDVEEDQAPIASAECPPRTAAKPRGHKKSESLNLKLELPELVDSPEQTPSPVKPPSKATRKNTTPKSKTPTPRVTRRNSSPRSVTPSAATLMKFETERSATIHGETSYKPQLRSIHEPLPLDKDDLNDRIDKFLTNFKIKRQESNLRAALSSIGQ